MTITLNRKNFKVSIYPVLSLDVKSIVESAMLLDMVPGLLMELTASN